MNKTINTAWVNKLQNEIDNTKGQFFSAKFIKRDGSTRVMLCRNGVRKGLKGGTLKYNPRERGNAVVWDVNKSAYRTIPLARVTKLKINKKTIIKL